MENTTNVPVATVTPEATTLTPTPAPEKKSRKGKWGKVGAPPKEIKFPRGAYTIRQLVAYQGLNEKGKPRICELTLRNTVMNAVRGFRWVKKAGQQVQEPVPVTIVRLPKDAEKDTVGRPNYRFMSKAAFEANQKNLKKTPANVTTPTTTPASTEAVTA